jgi:hypothetical protein
MLKNICKKSIWAWLALLLFVFSCGGEAEKERVRIERELKEQAQIKRTIQIAREGSIKREIVEDSLVSDYLKDSHFENEEEAKKAHAIVKNIGVEKAKQQSEQFKLTNDPEFQAKLQAILKGGKPSK